MPSKANEDSTITFSVTHANKAPIDDQTEAWLFDRYNAMIREQNRERADQDPPLDPLPEYTDLNVLLADVLVRGWRGHSGSYVMQQENERLEAAAEAAPRGQQIDSSNVLEGKATANPSVQA